MISSLEPVLSGILTLVATTMDDADRLPGRVYLAPGDTTAWDDCCGSEGEAAGQLYLRVAAIFPTGLPFPDPYRKPSVPCGAPLVGMTLGIGTVRCAHTVDDYGTAPTAEELTGDALALLEDSTLIWKALQQLDTVPGVRSVQIGSWAPDGPLGGCESGEWEVTVAVGSLCWIPDADGE